MQHQNKEVQTAIVRLSDALCMWERATSIESVLIIREVGGFEFRAVSGKPNIPADITDEQLFATIDQLKPGEPCKHRRRWINNDGKEECYTCGVIEDA